MPRWKPDARERLVAAAIRLFSEQGYDATTVAQIAEAADLTRSTFFRHFGDKRDVLAAGQESLSQLLREGVAAAPDDASPLTAVESGLLRASEAMTPERREMGPRLRAVIAASAELRERDQLKHVGLAAETARALEERGIAPRTAALAAEIGLLAFKNAYATWTDGDDSVSFADELCDELDALRATLPDVG
ncbi:TetR/AcrR family transcriptional regulator [Brachybacterium halotolerans subsp. kimchii]|uniref:TetR/AcrR family transcriptional regulator n=1 Tax=Brachybacterium halotolerans TaxID=2795215 RepID=UPI001E2ACA66|nr:TetR family transcriptional regulator [Brachybacterium halotolerans]UEJ81350.1 TetR/AcrR family transcriptional regulator [Brachybacterium halotolerans subsp. kimchii]